MTQFRRQILEYYASRHSFGARDRSIERHGSFGGRVRSVTRRGLILVVQTSLRHVTFTM